MFLAGHKVKNSPASKLASNFRPFDPNIMKLLEEPNVFYWRNYSGDKRAGL